MEENKLFKNSFIYRQTVVQKCKVNSCSKLWIQLTIFLVSSRLDVRTSRVDTNLHKLYGCTKSIVFASSRACLRPNSFSTIASANSMEVPGPLLVMRLPSTTTLFSTSLGSDSLLHNAGKAVAFLPWIKAVHIFNWGHQNAEKYEWKKQFTL